MSELANPQPSALAVRLITAHAGPNFIQLAQTFTAEEVAASNRQQIVDKLAQELAEAMVPQLSPTFEMLDEHECMVRMSFWMMQPAELEHLVEKCFDEGMRACRGR